MGRRGSPRRHGLQGRGTEDGITSLQMDLQGRRHHAPRITEKALEQAKAGPVCTSLAKWPRAMTAPASSSNPRAAPSRRCRIPTDKIREVIGSGGKVIREIVRAVGRQGRHQRRRCDQDRPAQRRSHQEKAYDNDLIRSWPSRRMVALQGQGREDRRFRRLRETSSASVTASCTSARIENRRLEPSLDVLKEGQEVGSKLLGFDERGKGRPRRKMVEARPPARSLKSQAEESAD